MAHILPEPRYATIGEAVINTVDPVDPLDQRQCSQLPLQMPLQVGGHQSADVVAMGWRRGGFRNEAEEPASVLMLFAPGAPREAYFEGFGALADMTDDERREWFVRHDNFFV
jgi:hypothetical protein